jgi:septum formation protein
VIPSTFAEDIDKANLTPDQYVTRTAVEKGKQVLQSLNDPKALIICADTIVVIGNDILEKPAGPAEAMSMLKRLSGRCHEVKTAVAILFFDGSEVKAECAVETTSVEFDTLSEEMMEAYIQTGEPFDKAGGYGIQGLAAFFVVRISGCYYNVMGFPASRLLKMLETVIR